MGHRLVLGWVGQVGHGLVLRWVGQVGHGLVLGWVGQVGHGLVLRWGVWAQWVCQYLQSVSSPPPSAE